MTSQQNLIELAKQGNPKAIENLINRQFQAKGITAKTALKDDCLQIMLEAAQIPNQDTLASIVYKGIIKLESTNIKTLKVYGRQTGEAFPAWSQEFQLLKESDSTLINTSKAASNKETKTANKINEETPNQISKHPQLAYGVVGYNGQILLTQKRVIIFRSGRNARTTQGIKGEKEIPINKITAVEFKRADNLTKGFLQFSILGSFESKGTVFDAVLDENTVMFTASQQSEFEEIKRYVDSIVDDEVINFNELQINKKASIEEIKAFFYQIQRQFEDESIQSWKRTIKFLLILILLVRSLYLIFNEQSQIIQGLIGLFGTAILFQPTCNLIEKQLKFYFSNTHKTIIVILTIIIGLIH